jgi:hypothetical protein
MNDPTTATTTTTATATATPASAASLQTQIDELRQRASELDRTADRAASTRYTERGAEFDQVNRAADAARRDSETARQQAENLREEARNRVDLADESARRQTQPGAETREQRQMVAREHALARAAEERADRLDQSADESWTRADDLHQRALELEQAAGDESVPNHLREASDKMAAAADQLDEKVRLLANADDIDRQAAEYETQGDTLNAEIFRGEAEAVRARADVIQPEIPEVDQRILDAAERPWAPDAQPVDGAGQPPADGQQPVPPTGPSGPMQPIDPYARADSDGDGLSDDVERRLGTNVNDADTDHDGYNDGLETGVPFYNPRVKEGEDLDPDTAAEKDTDIRGWEAQRGLAHNADSDGDGVADWVERFGLERVPNLTPDDVKNNLSPIDDFVESAKSQVGKPYQFGAEVEARQNAGGDAFDSGELVEWAAKQAGVRDMPDGTWKQYQFLHEQGATTSVEQALNTKGALVFGFSADPTTSTQIPDRRYVAISTGDGKNVIEVSERTGAVTVRPADGLYQYGATIPALHDPQGDLDGDGWSDKEETAFGGDPSRSITWSQDDGAIVVDPDASSSGAGSGSGQADPANPADPAAPVDPTTNPVAPGTTPTNTGIVPPADVTDPAADPLGTDRYPDQPDGATPYEDPTGAGGYQDTDYDASPADAYGDTGASYEPQPEPTPAPSAADAYGDTPSTPSPAPSAGDAYGDSSSGDSYGDSGSASSGDAYDDSYSDASTYE